MLGLPCVNPLGTLIAAHDSFRDWGEAEGNTKTSAGKLLWMRAGAFTHFGLATLEFSGYASMAMGAFGEAGGAFGEAGRAPEVPRVRHYTSRAGLEGIRNDGAINASRAFGPGRPLGVDVETQPFGPEADNIFGQGGPRARMGALSDEAFVEFDAPEGMISTPYTGAPNTARIVSDGPFDISGLNPTYRVVPFWKRFWW